MAKKTTSGTRAVKKAGSGRAATAGKAKRHKPAPKPAKKKRRKPFSSAGTAVEISITSPNHLDNLPQGNSFTVSGWMNPTSAALGGWVTVNGTDKTPMQITNTHTGTWSMTFAAPAFTGYCPVFVRATVVDSGGNLRTALDQILIQFS